jgi:uncharacterized protein YwqG
MIASKPELESALQEAGLGQWARRLIDVARPCIILVPGSIEESANAPLGQSRLGGAPDLPPDVAWPIRSPLKAAADLRAGQMPASVLLGPYHWLHRLARTQRWKKASRTWDALWQAEVYVRNRPWPLSFVAQLDFAELRSVLALDNFPTAGRLLLFCDPYELPWGKKEDQARAKVIFVAQPGERLERRDFPVEFDGPEAARLMPRGFAFKPRILRPTAWLLPPPLGSGPFLRLQSEAPDAWTPNGDAFIKYEQFWCDLCARHPDTFGDEVIHQVGGVAVPVQAPVEAEAERLAGDGSANADPWRLVLQIDSDVAEWGDGGRLYLCARERDLTERRFDCCWTIVQCY